MSIVSRVSSGSHAVRLDQHDRTVDGRARVAPRSCAACKRPRAASAAVASRRTETLELLVATSSSSGGIVVADGRPGDLPTGAACGGARRSTVRTVGDCFDAAPTSSSCGSRTRSTSSTSCGSASAPTSDSQCRRAERSRSVARCRAASICARRAIQLVLGAGRARRLRAASDGGDVLRRAPTSTNATITTDDEHRDRHDRRRRRPRTARLRRPRRARQRRCRTTAAASDATAVRLLEADVVDECGCRRSSPNARRCPRRTRRCSASVSVTAAAAWRIVDGWIATALVADRRRFTTRYAGSVSPDASRVIAVRGSSRCDSSDGIVDRRSASPTSVVSALRCTARAFELGALCASSSTTGSTRPASARAANARRACSRSATISPPTSSASRNACADGSGSRTTRTPKMLSTSSTCPCSSSTGSCPRAASPSKVCRDPSARPCASSSTASADVAPALAVLLAIAVDQLVSLVSASCSSAWSKMVSSRLTMVPSVPAR